MTNTPEGRSQAKSRFREYFNVNIGDYYDGMMSVMLGKITIDMFKFDDYLHRLYGEYELEEKSMSDIIIEKYGIEANIFINQLI